MPTVDLEGNPYIPPTTASGGGGGGGGGGSAVNNGSGSAVSNAVNSGPPPSTAGPDLTSTIQSAITSDPTLQQNQEWLNEARTTALNRAQTQAAWNEKEYQLARQGITQAASSSNASSGAAIAALMAQEQAAKELDALHREEAAHDLALQAKRANEVAASSGMYDSGQRPFQQGELQYAYDNTLKQIEIAAKARQAQLNASRASLSGGSNSSGTALALQKLDLAHEQDITRAQWAIEDINSKYKIDNGKLIMSTGQELASAWWDQDTHVYVGPGGERWNSLGERIG